MFETIMFLSVLGAVLFFGALISIGNERQRKAINGIREQAARWAETDIRLKRAMRDVRVPDARQWLVGVAGKVLGSSPQILALNPWEENGLKAIVCPCEDGRKLVLTPELPSRFVKGVQPKGGNRLSKADVSLLGDRPKRAPVFEMNIVTCGPFFDLEARQVWQGVTGSRMEFDRLYLFEVPKVSH